MGRRPDLESSIRKLFPTVAFLEKGRVARTRSGSGLTPGEGVRSPEVPLRQIGENRILRELGRGGMGIVYEAEQESLGRRVAVKILPGHAASDEKNRRRFVREAKAVARLQHPNIVPIYSVGEDAGIPYYVMALVEGTSMDRLLAGDAPDDPAGHPRWVGANREAGGRGARVRRTARASCIATSSRRTSCSTTPARSGSPTSGSPSSPTTSR